MDARTYTVSDKTREGTFVRIRAIQPYDRDRLTESFAEAAIEPDEGLVATVWIEGSERIVGFGGVFVDPWSEPSMAEAVVTVLEGWQDRGIGTVLFEHLASRITERGVFSGIANGELGQVRVMPPDSALPPPSDSGGFAWPDSADEIDCVERAAVR